MSRHEYVGHWKEQIPNSCPTNDYFRGVVCAGYLSLSSDPSQLCNTDVKYGESMPLHYISKCGKYTVDHGMFKI